jgi:phosphopantetheinyl transferase
MTDRDVCLVRYARLEDCLADAGLRSRLRGEEARHYDRIRDAARRRQWLAGRMLARELLCESLGLCNDRDLQIVSRNDSGLGSSPRVLLGNRLLDCPLSISHTSRGVLVALGSNGHPVGVDLCDVAPVAPGFLRLWFTPLEQSWIGTDRHRSATVWAIKEAVYKAVSQGAPWNPREIEVATEIELAHESEAAADCSARFSCRCRGRLVEPLTLWLRNVEGQIAAVAWVARDAAIRRTQRVRSLDAHVSQRSIAYDIASPSRVGPAPRNNSATSFGIRHD